MIATFIISVVALVFAIIIAIPMALYYGWAAHYLWNWFIVPLGFPPITVLQAWGISLALTTLRPRLDLSKSNETDWAKLIITLTIGPLIPLGMGYVIHYWWLV